MTDRFWIPIPEVFKFFIISVTILANTDRVHEVHGFNGTGNHGQIGSDLMLQSVDTTSHIINLSNSRNDTCINHKHEGNPPSSGSWYHLKIQPDEESRCFILYNDFNCQGPRLKFQNLVGERSLKLVDREAISNGNGEKLQNFDVAPNSISRCYNSPFPENLTKYDRRGGCGSNYVLRIWNSEKHITEECSNIFADESIKYATVQISIEKIQWLFYDDDDDGDKNYENGTLCIETYSQWGCRGEMIQFIIPESQTQTQMERSIKLWHFYARSAGVRDWNNGKTSTEIDTDIKSVRKCSCPWSSFEIASVDAKSHLINLNEYANNTCLNREVHGPGNPIYFMRIKPFKGSHCFIVYNEPNCQGARLKFHNVYYQKTLRFNREGIDHWNEEKLLNFYITPNSISRCPSASEFPEQSDLECESDYFLRMGGLRKMISEECTDINADEFKRNKYWFWWKSRHDHNKRVVIFLERKIPEQGSSHGGLRQQICIQIYSQEKCAGKMIQYIIAKPFTVKDLDHFRQRSIMIWQYYFGPIPNIDRRVKYDPIDTDIKSARKCPCQKRLMQI